MNGMLLSSRFEGLPVQPLKVGRGVSFFCPAWRHFGFNATDELVIFNLSLSYLPWWHSLADAQLAAPTVRLNPHFYFICFRVNLVNNSPTCCDPLVIISSRASSNTATTTPTVNYTSITSDANPVRCQHKAMKFISDCFSVIMLLFSFHYIWENGREPEKSKCKGWKKAREDWGFPPWIENT